MGSVLASTNELLHGFEQSNPPWLVWSQPVYLEHKLSETRTSLYCVYHVCVFLSVRCTGKKASIMYRTLPGVDSNFITSRIKFKLYSNVSNLPSGIIYWEFLLIFKQP